MCSDAADTRDALEPGDRFDSLLERLLIGELSEAEGRELAGLVEGNQERLRRYAETIHLAEAMRDFAGGLPPVTAASVGASVLSRFDAASGGANPTGRSATARLGWRNRTSFALAVCLALLVGGAIGVGLSGGPAAEQATARNGASELSPPPAPRPLLLTTAEGATANDPLGRISGLSPEASADGLLRPYQVGDVLRRGEVIQLTRGVLRVDFSAGPVAIIEGPAEFSVVADSAVFVRYGRLVSSASEAFVVQTSLLSAESTGASISIIANRDRSTLVYAERGEVDLRSNPELGGRKKLLKRLVAGEGVELAATGGKDDPAMTAAAPPAGMVHSWDDVLESLHPYERLVLSDRPLAYWPLHHVRRNRRVLDLTQNGHDGQAIGNWPEEVPSSTRGAERGAYFDGESYIESDRKPPIDIHTGFSVEGWAKVEGGPAYQSVFTSRWVLDTYTPNRQCLGFTLYAGSDDRWQFWTGNGRYGDLWDELIAEDTPIERRRWTHVAATFTPDPIDDELPLDALPGVARLYVDGRLVATDRHDVGLLDFEWPARIGAAEFVPNSLTSWLFRGELRDIAVYDLPLSAERVVVHYEAGRPHS